MTRIERQWLRAESDKLRTECMGTVLAGFTRVAEGIVDAAMLRPFDAIEGASMGVVLIVAGEVGIRVANACDRIVALDEHFARYHFLRG